MKSCRPPFVILLVVAGLGGLACWRLQRVWARRAERPVTAVSWRTDWSRHLIERDALQSGGPGKDGIPALTDPGFVDVNAARTWLDGDEPVVRFAVGDVARAYPVQILIWHEIVNDRCGDLPVAVTFCPLCHSALVFERRVQGQTLTLGVSGFLHQSDMIFYDRETESLWQQVTGQAVVGTWVGHSLRSLPAQIVSFRQFAGAFPAGQVLSRDTGYRRDYGRNPYVGYDDLDRHPFLFRGRPDPRLSPMARVVGLTRTGAARAYPHALLRERGVIEDTWADRPVVIFHEPTMRAALDASALAESRPGGSVGVFDRRLEGRALRFERRDGRVVDTATGSQWRVTGLAVSGPLAGSRLTPIIHLDTFAFAFLVFYPQAEIYAAPAASSR